MKKGVNKKGLQTLTFAIFVIGLVILIYYAPSITGFINNSNNQNENEILTFNLNQFLPLTTKLMINNETFSLQALLQDIPVTNITVDDNIIFGYNVTNLTFNLSKFNLTPGYYNFILINNNTIIASKEVIINETIINHAPIFSGIIPNQTWYKNTNLTDAFNLTDYFSDPDNDPLIYFHTYIDNISVSINDGSVTFVPDKDFIGIRYLQFIANDSINITYSNNLTLSVIAKEWNLTPTEELIQLKAEINNPVKWIKKIKFFATTKNATVTLPKEADLSNIKVKKVIDDFNKEEISPEKIKIKKEKEEQEEKYFEIYSIVAESTEEPIDNSGDIELIVEDEVKELEIEYETPAPYSIENIPIIENDKWKKIVNIFSDLHYEKVLAYTDIKETKKEQIHLYLLEEPEPDLYTFVKDNSDKETKRIEITDDPEFNVSFVDTDDDNLIDKIYWLTDLSNKSFAVEVDLTIINVQSYPTVGGNWTVAFTTTGIADLTITPIDGTTFTEIPDNTNTVNDLEFLELKCGNTSLENFFLVDSNGNLIPYKVYKIKRRIEEIKKRLKELEAIKNGKK